MLEKIGIVSLGVILAEMSRDFLGDSELMSESSAPQRSGSQFQGFDNFGIPAVPLSSK